jgi:cell division GTPase FtsZ
MEFLVQKVSDEFELGEVAEKAAGEAARPCGEAFEQVDELLVRRVRNKEGKEVLIAKAAGKVWVDSKEMHKIANAPGGVALFGTRLEKGYPREMPSVVDKAGDWRLDDEPEMAGLNPPPSATDGIPFWA